MPAPTLIMPIPAQVVNEKSPYGPFYVSEFFESVDANEEPLELRIQIKMAKGGDFPKGLVCTSDGVLNGIPAEGTQGNYEFLVIAENAEGQLQANVSLAIKPSLDKNPTEYAEQLKSQVWHALGQNMPMPELSDLLNRPITPLDIYYLMEQWAVLTMWDAYNLDPASDKKALSLEGTSKHYNIYDRGSCLIASPKDLFSHERTIADGIQTARVMAREIYKRGWTVEMAGFEKLTRAAWVEIQHQIDLHGKPLEIINYHPSPNDISLYNAQALSISLRSAPE